MLDATIKNPHASAANNAELQHRLGRLRAENERLRAENERLRAENERLHAENTRLRATLEAYVTRARSTATYGPVEMSAGTCVGPRRRSFERRKPSYQ